MPSNGESSFGPKEIERSMNFEDAKAHKKIKQDMLILAQNHDELVRQIGDLSRRLYVVEDKLSVPRNFGEGN